VISCLSRATVTDGLQDSSANKKNVLRKWFKRLPKLRAGSISLARFDEPSPRTHLPSANQSAFEWPMETPQHVISISLPGTYAPEKYLFRARTIYPRKMSPANPASAMPKKLQFEKGELLEILNLKEGVWHAQRRNGESGGEFQLFQKDVY
jgi:hypothetical protein